MTLLSFHRYTREELLNAVWSDPIRTLARKLDVTDVAIAKACRRAAIPTPDVGYWMKRRTAKSPQIPKLPPRPLGMNHIVAIGRGQRHWNWENHLTDEELLGPIPDPPTFSESMEDVRSRATPLIKTVSLKSSETHLRIRKLLDEDKARREKQRLSSYISAWDKPRFESPIERRRLRILNALFVALQRAGSVPDLHKTEYERLAFSVRVGDQSVHFALDPLHQSRIQKTDRSNQADRLILRINHWGSKDKWRAVWEDNGDSMVEGHLTTIAIELLVTGEIMHREAASMNHDWRIERKRNIEERIQREKIEGTKRERERLAALQQARIDRLMKEAAALRLAQDIRTYVVEARLENERSATPASAQAIESWAKWALHQADAIDPIRSRGFLIKEEIDAI